MFWKVYQKDNIDMNRTSETNANFAVPTEVEKSELSTKRPTTLKISDMKP